MTVQNSPAATVAPLAPPIVTPPKAPPDTPPSVSISAISGTPLAGVQITIVVWANEGERWVWNPNDRGWESEPIVSYTQMRVSIDGVQVFSRAGGGGSIPVTFTRPGQHTLTASGVTADGQIISSGPMNVRVTAAAAPAFTLTGPANGAAVPLNEGGATIGVQFTTTSDQYFPFTVSITRDGVTTSESFTGTSYQRAITLAPTPLGSRSISITCADPDGRATTAAVTLVGSDIGLPHLDVVFPQPSANLVGDGTGVPPVPMNGTTSDPQSGMVGGSASVTWALTAAGMRTTAIPATAGDFRNWTAPVPLTGFGAHTIFVWATDAVGNVSATSVPVNVISSYEPATLDERLNEREYLASLLSFAQEQVSLAGPAPTPLDTPTLVAALGQPVDRLSQPLSAAVDQGNREVNELRVPVELLRAYIKATNGVFNPAGEATYRSAAYAALLAAAGTSYSELRLSRGAAPAERAALAARLGIRLSAKSPDELNQLTLDAPSEAALEHLFGLSATTLGLDPLRVLPLPLLLTWRLSALALSWAEQDQHPNAPRAFSVLADPDLVSSADVVVGATGNPVRALLAARAKQLATFVATLAAARKAAADPSAALTAIQAAALPAGLDLAALEIKDGQGVDIGAQLAVAGLTRAGFLYLRQLSRLASGGTVTAAEWTDADAVLTGAQKRRVLYPAWRGQEAGFVLSPDFFTLHAGAPPVSPFRVDRAARADWESVLRTRITERRALVDADTQAVAEAEQLALPVLRQALLGDLATPGAGDIGETMSARFQLDVLASGTLRTTRLQQAIVSVQSLLWAKRSGKLPADHPAATWTITDIDGFTKAWRWMGELAGWRSATTAFLFPEPNLDPTSLVPATGPLATLFANLQNLTSGSASFSAADLKLMTDAYLGARGLGGISYLDPVVYRSLAHQNALRALSKNRTEPDPSQPENREIFWAVPMLVAQRLQAAGDYQAALDWYWIVYAYDLASPVSIYNRIGTEISAAPKLTFPPHWTTVLEPFSLLANRPTAPYTRYTLLAIIRCQLDYADAEFSRQTDESIAHARGLYVAARDLLATPALIPIKPSNPGEPALAIPDLTALANRAQVQLAKIRQGRNIAGIARSQGFGAASVVQPTPYRFKVLLERAKQLAAQAGQMEAGYLAALEKYDAGNLRIFDALKGVDLSAAQVSVATARVTEANDEVTAAITQQAKADTMAVTYASMIAAPPNQYEQNLLSEYTQMRDVKDWLANDDTAIGIAQAAAQAASLTNEVFSFGGAAAASLAVAGTLVVKDVHLHQENSLEAQMQANQLQAGLEQRRQDWRVQQTAAEQDSLVATTQVVTAKDQVTIAVQDQAVASLQYDQAVATLKFLNNQFTNPDLYLWMSTTLGGVYRYFLQQATAIARLAQAQLAFERAEPAQTLVRNDYWQAPAELTATTSQPDRRGLTGAEQLAQDLTQLDQHAFNTDRRRLNLSQTFSLSRLMPVEFLEFRRTGTLAFATPMALFDGDFPGHYLRLIRQVRTSLVALVPPDRGIRATLYSNGISRVTTGADGTFSDVVLRSDPGVVALTSPVSASGVFELDAQSELLLPFEGSGVDTTWEFQLPPAANPFDYSSIVDVMVTIDYTARYDDVYRSQVVTRLNSDRSRGADRVFSLARDFPDQWYDLNNPADPASRSVTITLRDIDFPAGIDALAATGVAVRLAVLDSDPVPNTVVTLGRGSGGGAATAIGGVASTRRGNAAGWNPLIGPSPAGDWQLTFGSDARALFDAGRLDDIVLVVSWTGHAPTWAS